MDNKKSQSDKFKEAARDLDCHEDEARLEKRLKDVAIASRLTGNRNER